MIKILIVDDDSDQLFLIKYFINQRSDSDSYKIVTANDGNSALEVIKDHHFDFIITDNKMPGLDGLELIKELKRLNVNVPVIVYSAYTDNLILEECMNENVKEILVKPFNQAKLNSLIDYLKSNNQN